MDKFLVSIFQSELRLQCKALLVAADDLDTTVKSLDSQQSPADFSASMDRVWIDLQQLLVSGANISKLLWGSRGKATNSRADFRVSVGVADSSPLQDTDLRNDWEHFDERLQSWYDTSQNKIFVGRNIGRFTAINAGDPQQRFSHYDPSTGEVSFWSHSCSVPALIQEARTILSHLEAAR